MLTVKNKGYKKIIVTADQVYFKQLGTSSEDCWETQ